MNQVEINQQAKLSEHFKLGEMTRPHSPTAAASVS